jgi:hypothetical protein
VAKTKDKFIQIRVNPDEERWIEALAADYRLNRSELILLSLNYIREERPAFTIEPRGKELAPAGMMG